MSGDFKILHSDSEAETEEIGKKVAKSVKYGTVISLKGNLGTGKTIFIKGFAKGIGITEIVSSPTFNIVREHNAGNGKWLYHMDLYRINDAHCALAFGIDEYMSDKNAMTLIEWAERIEEILPPQAIHVEIKRINDTEREIKITPDVFKLARDL
jgi:tRNA threonylcarbamoyladenosine biosynthesis protein TsaE